MAKLFLLNGPNLNLLGKREPDIYGRTTLADIEADITSLATDAGLECECLQSNAEHVLVDAVQQTDADIILLNAGAFTHTSVALRDALKGTGATFIEIHISNVHAREDFRHHSYLSDIAAGIIVGFGVQGYRLGLQAALTMLEHDR